MELNIQLEEYLKRFRIFYPKSLFEPDFSFLKEFRCPICYRKLYWNREKTVARCKSVKNDKFFIRKDVLSKLKLNGIK
jgi:hypothetical protein